MKTQHDEEASDPDVLAGAMTLSLPPAAARTPPLPTALSTRHAAPLRPTAKTYKVAVIKQLDHASLDEIANAVTAELDQICRR
ncbi:MAG: hypothetical protein ACLU38_12600 [Dysosmobacter sp.]